ncbi:MAG TPA: SCO family protein [Gemmataceae bacterium]|nr:SCO family protein [Gemmataceae bacterium]
MTALAGAGQPACKERTFAVCNTRQFVNSMVVCFLGLALLAGAAWGQGMGNGIMSPPPNVRPPGLKNVGIQQNLNQQIPPDLIFTDDLGRKVRLGDYFAQKPLILNFVYYGCPMLCGEELNGLESTLRVLKFDLGKEFEVITISFDPKDTPEMAAKKKDQFLRRYNRPGAERGWHFLVGQPAAIDAVTKAAGFQYQYDEKTGQFAHSTAILVLTPKGKIAQYYYGIEYPPKDLRLALVEASENRIGNVMDELLLYCYHYDPEKGKYSATVMRVLRLMGVATMLCLGALLFVLIRRNPDNFHGAAQVR